MAAIVLFDGVCNLCNGAVDFILERDPAGHFRFASFQSEAARPLLERCKLPRDFVGAVVLIEDGVCHTRSRAALRIARRLRRPWPLLYGLIVLPAPVRDAVYDWIARNRYRWFGKRDTCRVPTPELQTRFL